MIQELFGVSGLLAAAAGDNTKTSINTNNNNNASILLDSNSPSTSTSLSAAATVTTATATATATANSEPQNLRCPRCDSSNTKFCYYNNYNLTQPRHFCKTCRRYWTKGGALRNVPIGGGCRKNKSAVAAAVGKSAAAAASGKIKAAASEMLGRVGFGSNEILWGSPQNSHLLAILRSATQTQTLNPNPNNLAGSHVISDPAATTTPFHARTTSMGFDPVMNHMSSLGLCSSYWRNNQTQALQQQNGYPHGGGGGGDQVTCGGGIQELYQKLKSSSSNYLTDGQHGSVGMTTNVGTAAVLETAPVGGGETTGYWNPGFCWSDVHASANGAYP